MADRYADLEIRILEEREQGYPVEMRLNQGPEFGPGYLDPTFLPWVPSRIDAARSGTWRAAGHSGGVFAVAVYDGGRRALSASADKTLKVWDLESGVCLATFSGDSDFLTCAVTPEGRTVVAGDRRGQVHILRLEEPE